jgi:hypothetical protein
MLTLVFFNKVKYAVDLLLKLLVRWQDSSRPDGSLTGVHSYFVEVKFPSTSTLELFRLFLADTAEFL